jgi:hypothetical protein
MTPLKADFIEKPQGSIMPFILLSAFLGILLIVEGFKWFTN